MDKIKRMKAKKICPKCVQETKWQMNSIEKDKSTSIDASNAIIPKQKTELGEKECRRIRLFLYGRSVFVIS